MSVNISLVNLSATYKDVKFNIRFLKSDESAISILKTILYIASGYLVAYHEILVKELPRLSKKNIEKIRGQVVSYKGDKKIVEKKLIDCVKIEDSYYSAEDYERVRKLLVGHNKSIISDKKNKVREVSGEYDCCDVLNHYSVYLNIHSCHKDSLEIEGNDNKIIGGHVKGFICPDFHLHNLTIQNVTFEDCTIEFDFFDNVKMKNCKFVNCDITINPRWSTISNTSFVKTIVRLADFGGVSFSDSCSYTDFECIISNHSDNGFRYKLPPEEYIK